MKINEFKIFYVKYYDLFEDFFDDDDVEMLELLDLGRIDLDCVDGVFFIYYGFKCKIGIGGILGLIEDDIFGLLLGEFEEEVFEYEFGDLVSKRLRVVYVDSNGSMYDMDGEEYLVGMSVEEREKYCKFEEFRKKYYEMKNVVLLLGYFEDLEDVDEGEDDEDDDEIKKVLLVFVVFIVGIQGGL